MTSPSPCREEDGEQKSSRPAWAVTSVIGIALSCVVSVTVPFFDIIVAAIGALGDLAAAYALPALFVLASSPAPWLHHAGLVLLRYMCQPAPQHTHPASMHPGSMSQCQGSYGRRSRCC